jgi:hypothetical protein
MKTRSSFAVMFALVFAAILSSCGASASNTNSSSSPANSAGSGASGAGSPADAAKGYFVALYSGAATDLLLCTGNPTATDPLKKMGNALSASITGSGAKVDTAGLTYETANQTGDSADVKVSGKIKTTTTAGTSTESNLPTQTLKMKNDNGWKVCGMGASA